MRTTLLCGAILVLAACDRNQPEPDAEPRVDLPWRTTTAAPQPAGPDSVTLTLTADGRILAQGRAWSLDGLDEFLRTAVRREGPSYYASTVVRLRIDRAVPWIHVRWLAQALARRFVHEIRFAYAASGPAEVDLPCGISSLIGDPAEPAWRQVLQLRIVVDIDGRPRCGEWSAADASAVDRWAAEARMRVEAGDLAGLCSDLVPSNGTAWGRVAAVYERLLAGGAGNLEFGGGTLAAPPDVRGLARLPRPDPTVAARAADGSRDPGGMRVVSVWRLVGPVLGPESKAFDSEIPLEEPEPCAPGDVDDR